MMVTQTAIELAQDIGARRITATQAVRHTLAQIDAHNPTLNAFTNVLHEQALHDAAAIDDAIAQNKPAGALAGVPFAVKNLFDVSGVVTLAGSKVHASYPPAQQHATVVARLKAAGAILVGTLNMDEYAYGFVTENQHYGTTRNPHDVTRIAGGSSGGSAAAVAADLVPISLGTDTNGSIRVPAALCGVYGLKPTFGRLPRTGTFFLSPSLDCVGPFANTVRDLALAYDVLQGHDPRDPAQSPRSPQLTQANLHKQDISQLRFAVATGFFETYAEAQARAAVEYIAKILNVSRRVAIPEAERARAAAFVITASESGNLHLANLKTRAAEFDIATRDRLLANTLTPASWVVQAQRFRRWFVNEVAKLFETVDVILAPATPYPAIPIGSKTIRLNGQDLLARAAMGMLTQPISLAGLPVVCVPLKRMGALPLGVQIITAPWREDIALAVAAALEQRLTA